MERGGRALLALTWNRSRFEHFHTCQIDGICARKPSGSDLGFLFRAHSRLRLLYAPRHQKSEMDGCCSSPCGTCIGTCGVHPDAYEDSRLDVVHFHLRGNSHLHHDTARNFRKFHPCRSRQIRLYNARRQRFGFAHTPCFRAGMCRRHTRFRQILALAACPL